MNLGSTAQIVEYNNPGSDRSVGSCTQCWVERIRCQPQYDWRHLPGRMEHNIQYHQVCQSVRRRMGIQR